MCSSLILTDFVNKGTLDPSPLAENLLQQPLFGFEILSVRSCVLLCTKLSLLFNWNPTRWYPRQLVSLRKDKNETDFTSYICTICSCIFVCVFVCFCAYLCVLILDVHGVPTWQQGAVRACLTSCNPRRPNLPNLAPSSSSHQIHICVFLHCVLFCIFEIWISICVFQFKFPCLLTYLYTCGLFVNLCIYVCFMCFFCIFVCIFQFEFPGWQLHLFV